MNSLPYRSQKSEKSQGATPEPIRESPNEDHENKKERNNRVERGTEMEGKGGEESGEGEVGKEKREEFKWRSQKFLGLLKKNSLPRRRRSTEERSKEVDKN